MPKIPGIGYAQAIRALQKVGFEVVREGKHTVMSDGGRMRAPTRWRRAAWGVRRSRVRPVIGDVVSAWRARCRNWLWMGRLSARRGLTGR